MVYNQEHRVVAARLNSSTTNIGTSPTAITFATVEYDTINAVSASVFTAKSSGYYTASAYLNSANTAWTAGHYIEMFLYKGGSNYTTLSKVIAASTGSYRLSPSGSTEVYLNAGDTLQLYAEAAVSGALPSGSGNAWFSVSKIQGPSQVAATETVSARYYAGSATATTSGTKTIVNFNTKEWDSHNAVTTGASWVFTAPISGKYEVTSNIEFQDTTASGFSYTLYAFKNAVEYTICRDRKETATNLFWYLNGSTTFNLLAGETIQIKAQQVSGGALNIDAATDTWVTITRVGNY